MQSVSSRIWTRVAVSISYGDNHYTTEIICLSDCIQNYVTSDVTILLVLYTSLFILIWISITNKIVLLYFDLRPEQNAIQGDAPEGSDTFQWQLGEEIAWAEIG